MTFAESLEKATKMHKKALKKTLFTTLKNLLKSVFSGSIYTQHLQNAHCNA